LSPISQLLRLLLLLLTPMWLSLAVEGLGLHGSLMSGLRRTPQIDSALAPPTGWRERGYLAANPDVVAAIRSGQASSGYAHYVQHGRAEGRTGGFVELGKEPAKAVPPAQAATRPPAQLAAQLAAAQTAVSQPVASPAPPVPVPAAPVPAVKPDPRGDAAPAQPVSFQPAARPGTQRPEAQRPEGQRHVERIRTANGGDGLRIVLDLDQDPRYETPVRRPDGRLEVRLPGTLWQAAPSGRLPATALGYRAERDGGGTRLLFSDEDGEDDAKGAPVRLLAVSTLAPDKDRGHRLVIDVALPSMAKAERARTAGGR
jgi:hypothetical protein